MTLRCLRTLTLRCPLNNRPALLVHKQLGYLQLNFRLNQTPNLRDFLAASYVKVAKTFGQHISHILWLQGCHNPSLSIRRKLKSLETSVPLSRK